jgi:hypothetical protein
MTRASAGALWVIRRVGAGLMVMLAAAAVVWMVFEVCDNLRTALTVLMIMVAFFIGHWMIGKTPKS